MLTRRKDNKNPANRGAGISGGDEGDRTLDLRIANATLSQLSYVPTQNNYSANAAAGSADVGMLD